MATITIPTRTRFPFAIVEIYPAKPERPGYEGRILPAQPAGARVCGTAATPEAAKAHALAKARTHYFKIKFVAVPVVDGKVEVEV